MPAIEVLGEWAWGEAGLKLFDERKIITNLIREMSNYCEEVIE